MAVQNPLPHGYSTADVLALVFQAIDRPNIVCGCHFEPYHLAVQLCAFYPELQETVMKGLLIAGMQDEADEAQRGIAELRESLAAPLPEGSTEAIN